VTYDVSADVSPDMELHFLWESVTDGGVAVFSTDAITTFGKQGWTNSSSMTVTAYAYYYRSMTKFQGAIKTDA
jgi:hypothetical protein